MDIATVRTYGFALATYVRTCGCARFRACDVRTYVRRAERTYDRNVALSVRTYVRTYAQRDIANYVRTYVCTHVRTYVRAYMSTYVRTCVRTCVRTYVSTKPGATVGTGTTRRTRPGTTGTTGTTTARPRTYACTDVRRRAPFRLTATLAQPLRVRRSPERSPRVSATLALRTHWFEQTNVRTPRCTLADRLVLMAMAVTHHQKASRRELKHTCKRTHVRRTSKMQASKLAVTVT